MNEVKTFEVICTNKKCKAHHILGHTEWEAIFCTECGHEIEKQDCGLQTNEPTGGYKLEFDGEYWFLSYQYQDANGVYYYGFALPFTTKAAALSAL
jgi:hypothetical protein